MMEELLRQLETVQTELQPQFNALRGVMGALQGAVKLASAAKPDALPMQKALLKLQQASAQYPHETLNQAVSSFAAATQTALDSLAFEFATDLREAFTARGEVVDGRPPVLGVGLLTLKIDMATRKGQWLYGKEPVTPAIPLSLTGILKTYDQQNKLLSGRQVDAAALVEELRKAWQDCLEAKGKARTGRVNLVEAYSKLTLNRQSNRFWNQPSRQTFKDYERVLFVRDLVLIRDSREAVAFRLGIATKSQTDQASRSIWLPTSALEGEYYSDITFD